MCQILVFNAINTIVTDIALHVSNDYINIYYWNLQFLRNGIINKTKVFL